MNPVISIIVPCYNQAAHLSETLQSVFEQEYRDWECIIVNDGSADNSEEIALTWVKKDNRFRYYPKKNTGVSDTRNFAIREAKGEFILPLDGDDRISPQYLKEGLEIFRKHPDTKLVYCNTILFGSLNKKVDSPRFNFENLLFNNYIFCSAIFRRSDFLETNGYNTNMVEGLEDWDFWISFLNEEDQVFKLDGYHFFYRIKEVSRSTSIDNDKNRKLLRQIFNNHLPLYMKYSNPIRDHNEAIFYKNALDRFRKSREYKLGSFFFWPLNYIKRVIWRRSLNK